MKEVTFAIQKIGKDDPYWEDVQNFYTEEEYNEAFSEFEYSCKNAQTFDTNIKYRLIKRTEEILKEE